MNQEIAKYLCDKDLASFALVQHETLYAVVPANAGHWPVRFREQFDLRKNSKFSYRSPISIMEDYKMRKCFFTPKVFFTLGNKDAQRSCLMVIRRMINGAFSSPLGVPIHDLSPQYLPESPLCILLVLSPILDLLTAR